jgi:hypothetical protein
MRTVTFPQKTPESDVKRKTLHAQGRSKGLTGKKLDHYVAGAMGEKVTMPVRRNRRRGFSR